MHEPSRGVRVKRTEGPVSLYRGPGHEVYWLGVSEDSAFRCNVYLIKSGDGGLIIDPGGRNVFASIRAAVERLMPAASVTGMVLCHQDPDVAASMTDWLDVNPRMKVITTPRTQVLLPYYGRADYDFFDVEAQPELVLDSGGTLRFIPAPFLHFPGAFVTYDTVSRFLFSGDIWAALDFDWQLHVSAFDDHAARMDLFHTEYIPSNIAARGFVRRIEHLPIDAILPQHGSIIGRQFVPQALDYLRHLQCGLDIIYADLQ